MGIKDLLKFMKPYIEPIHIKIYAGKRVGIDAYSWLHKGAYSCSLELCLNSDSERKSRFLEYFMHRINMLRYFNITPVVVFDGGNLPCKAATEEDRERRRSSNHELAMVKLKEGNICAATALFQRAVSITPFMAYQLIQILRSEDIEFVVAPYEADAQLAHLSSLAAEKGGIAAVITEDSDLMAYGCPAIVFKMDRYGNGEKMELEKVFEDKTSKPSFKNFNLDLFTGMCVLAGCDFLSSIPGIGIGRAHALVSKYRKLDRVLSVLKLEKGNQVPEDYGRSFKEAVAVFQYAQIYDANARELRHMKPLSQELLLSVGNEVDFLGPKIPPAMVIAIAEGHLNPITMEAFDRFPHAGNYVNHSVHKASDKYPEIDAMGELKKDSCFSVVSSQNAKRPSTVTRQTLVSKEEKSCNDILALEKLVRPTEACEADNYLITCDKTPLNVPNNNPFRIGERTETHLMHKESTAEQVLLVRKAEDPGPGNIQNKVSENFLRKRKLQATFSDQIESITEELSVVTEEDNSDTVCTDLESQESVKSKPRKSTDRKRRGDNEKKLKKSKSKKSENKNGTILNFFSRV